jgi:hypothetical protein
LATVIKAIQFLAVLAGGLALGSALNAYSGLYRLAQTGAPITAALLAQFPDSLRWHVATFVAGMLVVWLLERVYRRLRPNNSFKPTPLRGAA